MIKIIFVTVLLFIPFMNATAGDLYGGDGSYQGQITNDGSIYGGDGSYQGQINNDGSMYGGDGSYQGQINNDGTLLSGQEFCSKKIGLNSQRLWYICS